MTKVKICGLKSSEDIDVINKAGADFAGFIMTASRRQINPEAASTLILKLNSSIQAVGVYRNEPVSQIVIEQALAGFSIIQLHTRPDRQRFYELRQHLPAAVQIWQSIHVRSDLTDAHKDPSMSCQLTEVSAFSDMPDGVLFDASAGGSSGGTGKSFSWRGIRALYDRFKLTGLMIAAGGLHINNVSQAICCLQPDIVDCSSGVENERGKDQLLTVEFCSRVKQSIKQQP